MDAAPDRRAWLGPALAACAAFAIHAACGGRYGVFRDELYFLACGERLAWGYVDQPPAIAVVARAAHALFGVWVPGLRLLPWIASALAVLLAGRLAVRLGGGAFAALLASIAVLAAPVLLALGHYLTMNAFEPVLFLLLAGALARVVATGDGRWLVAAGALVGLGLLTKYTMGLYAGSLAAGLLATRERRLLLGRWAAAGAALAAMVALPNFLWQAAHGFPFLELVRNGQLYKNAPVTPLGFLGATLLEMNPLTAPLWLGGLAWLLAAREARPFRFLGIAFLVLAGVDLATGAKPYYLAAAFPPLLAAGGVAAERVLRRTWVRSAAAAALAASLVPLAPGLVPVLPEERFVAWRDALGLPEDRLERSALGALPQIFADQHGWPELARAVAAVYAALPAGERARAFVFGQNYGEAAAVEILAPAMGLEVPPVVSGHNSYWLWGLPAGRDLAIVVSDEREDCGRGLFRSRALAARLPSSPWVMPYEDARQIWICRDPDRPPAAGWSHVRHYE